MKYFLTSLFLCLIAPSFYAQNNYFSYKTIRYGEDFMFPVFAYANDTHTAEKINELLQISELNLLKGHEKDNIFEEVMVDEETMTSGKDAIQFEVLANNNKILSIGFEQEFVSASSSYWTQYYNFNAGNGDLIQLKDLFTEEGYPHFYQYAAKKRASEFQKEEQKLSAEEKDESVEMNDAFFYEDDLSYFYIIDSVVYIDGENMFPRGVNMSGIEVICAFNLSEFSAYLNDYGKSVFGLSQAAVQQYHSASLPQIFEGTIAGKLNVILVLNQADKEGATANYVYKKFGKAISWQGIAEDNRLKMNEIDANNDKVAAIDVNYNGTKIEGNWIGSKGTFKIELKRK